MEMDKTVNTSDLGTATFLHSIGCQLQTIDRRNPKRIVFQFLIPSDQTEALTRWQSGTAKVNALGFWHSFQDLKAKLFRDGNEYEHVKPFGH